MKKPTKVSQGKKIAIGSGIAAVTVASAGAYYLLGPNKKAHQKKVKAIAIKIKKEATREIKKAKAVTIPLYHHAVDIIAENYAKQYKMHEKDIHAIAKKLKGELREVKALVKKTAKKSAKIIKNK